MLILLVFILIHTLVLLAHFIRITVTVTITVTITITVTVTVTVTFTLESAVVVRRALA